MKKTAVVFLAGVFCFSLFGMAVAYAEDSTAATPTTAGDWKEEKAADMQKFKEQRQTMKEHARASKTEEKDLHKQIREAKAAGDTAKVKELQGQLKTTHQENVQQRKEDKKAVQGAKKEFRQDRKAARAGKKQ